MTLPTTPEMPIPFALAWALFELDTCPSCLGRLKDDLCLKCEMDFANLVTFAELRAESLEALQ